MHKARCFFSRLPASLNTLGGWLRTGGNCVLVVRDGGVLHSSLLLINSLSGQLLSVLDLKVLLWWVARVVMCATVVVTVVITVHNKN